VEPLTSASLLRIFRSIECSGVKYGGAARRVFGARIVSSLHLPEGEFMSLVIDIVSDVV
jgi:hypothetical protein